MRKFTVRVSPNGRDILHVYSDAFRLDAHCDVEIERASDVFFDNEMKRWCIRDLADGSILPVSFLDREEAIEHEKKYLERKLRERVI